MQVGERKRNDKEVEKTERKDERRKKNNNKDIKSREMGRK